MKQYATTPVYNIEDFDLDEYIDDLFASIDEEERETDEIDDWLDADPFTEEGLELLNMMKSL